MNCNFYRMLKCVKEIGFTLRFYGKSGEKNRTFFHNFKIFEQNENFSLKICKNL